MSTTQKKVTAVIACFMSLLLVITMTPTIAFGKAIYTDARAKALAKNKVGKSAIVTQVESDYDNGGLFYEVNLVKKNRSYELLYRAKDSKLVEYQWELRYKGSQKRTGHNLSKATIKKKAKRLVRNARITSTRLTHDDGLAVYKLIMKKGSKKYTLEYNAKSASLIEYDWKTVTKKAVTTKYIGLAKAKKAALKRVPNATVKACNFEWDDGVPVYEVKLLKNNYVYEVVVHARTGKILEYDRESIYDYIYD